MAVVRTGPASSACSLSRVVGPEGERHWLWQAEAIWKGCAVDMRGCSSADSTGATRAETRLKLMVQRRDSVSSVKARVTSGRG
jgi:hypothetical protein